MKDLVFVDASAWVAISNRTDRHHGDALRLYHQLLRSATRLITSTWTAYEAVSIVKTKLSYKHAERFWQRILQTSVVSLIKVSDRIEADALRLFWDYRDKDWGVVDCASLRLMEEADCHQAFAFDRHFTEASKQYGFSLVGSS